ncbi:MAG: PAS domain-containing protein [Bacteroidales bacterium]|nr:PAS domain-containing protein [Bacteroidales bacterium]
MALPPLTFKGFFEKYSKRISKADCQKKSYNFFNNYPLLPSQALYVLDIKDMTIPYQRGITKLLGYTKEEFTWELLDEFYHPEDHERYVHLVKISNEWARSLKPEPFTVEASIDYRVRKKDGTYLKIYRQSTIFENCVDKSIKSVFSLISDISGIKTDTSVNLSVIDLKSGRVLLEDAESEHKPIIFTEREKEIIMLMKTGLNSSSIAEHLQISRHTVDTFRRKMLKKTGCKNTIEVIDYCTRMGVI